MKLELRCPAAAENAPEHARVAVELFAREFERDLDFRPVSIEDVDTQLEQLREEGLTAADLGEALFAVASCAGLMYLIQDDMIKKKKTGSLIRLFPSLRDLDRINHLCLVWGFPLLTLGVLAGSLWARIVWGSHWQWDSKQVWTLLAWGSYGFLLHQRLAIGWQGRRAARWSSRP